MAVTHLLVAFDLAAVDAGATLYCPPSGSIGVTNMNTTEALAQARARDQYALSGLYVTVTANTLTGTTTATLRKNGANASQAVSIGAGLTGAFQDTLNSDSLASGDLFCTRFVTGAGGLDALTVAVVAYNLRSPTGTSILIISNPGQDILSAGATRYQPIGGARFTDTTESWVQYTFRVAATLSNLRVLVQVNSRNGATTIRTRKNGANGNQSVSIGASTTGDFEDTTNADPVSPGDLINYQEVAGGSSGNIRYGVLQMKLQGTRAVKVMIAGSTDGNSIGINLTAYIPLEGGQSITTLEASARVTCAAPYTARNGLFKTSKANTWNGTTTATLRKNGASQTITMTIPASTTGTYEDTANQDSFAVGDTIDWVFITAGGSAGTFWYGFVGVELAPGWPARASTPARTTAALVEAPISSRVDASARASDPADP